jgi:hypothetical protein
VVEHSHHFPKVEGSSSTVATGTMREKMANKLKKDLQTFRLTDLWTDGLLDLQVDRLTN